MVFHLAMDALGIAAGKQPRHDSPQPADANPGHGRYTDTAYVPLSFATGEAYQFDWSYASLLNARPLPPLPLPYLLVRAYPRETRRWRLMPKADYSRSSSRCYDSRTRGAERYLASQTHCLRQGAWLFGIDTSDNLERVQNIPSIRGS